jgi:hypothetical protein
MRAKALGMAALALVLALAFVPLAAADLAISHPRLNDIQMRVGESRTYEIAIYNYGGEPMSIMMAAEGLEGIVRLEPENFTIGPGTSASPTIEKVTVIFTPSRAGIFEGNILACPVEPGTGIRVGSSLGCHVKITATEAAPEENNENNEQAPGGGGGKGGSLVIPVMICGLLVAAMAGLFLRRRKTQMPYYMEKTALIAAATLILMSFFPSTIRAGENSIQGSVTVTAPVPYKVDVSISPSSRTGAAGENLTFTVKVWNQGDNMDNYDLTVADTAGWAVALSENYLENVAAGENRTVALSVKLGGSGTDTVIVTATSKGDNTVKDNASCTATVEEAGGGGIIPAPQPQPQPERKISPNWFWVAFGTWAIMIVTGGQVVIKKYSRYIKDYYIVTIVSLILLIIALVKVGLLEMVV